MAHVSQAEAAVPEVLRRPRRGGQRPGATLSFDTAAAAEKPPCDFALKSRVYVPFGIGAGFGFGMGASESVSYDAKERFLYALSAQGALNVVDYADPRAPAVVPSFAVGLPEGTPRDVEVCGGLVFVSVSAPDVLRDGFVVIFSAADRAWGVGPRFRTTVAVGPLPDQVLPNADCSVLAVANEGPGRYSDAEGLRDPVGSVDLVWDLWAKTPQVYRVSLRGLGSDRDLLKKGVHLPLPLKAQAYWQDFSGLEVNFTAARRSYTADTNLEPEYLGWSADGHRLYVNLQENNAVATIEFSRRHAPTATEVSSLGLKDWSRKGGTQGLDVVGGDQTCNLVQYPGFYSLRHADGMAVVTVDGGDYILTANEADDKSYGAYEELVKEDEVLDEHGRVLLQGVSATRRVVSSHLAGLRLGADPDRRIGLGSSAVDYSDPRRPVLKRLVSHGGRGLSIFRKTYDGLELAWDSGSDLEREQCAAFPWAHNGEQDEEFAPLFGVLYNTTDDQRLRETIEENNDRARSGCADGGDGRPGACPLGETVDARSPKDGAAAEAVVVGVACGRLLAVLTTEKQGSAFVYDITDVWRPRLLFVRHLSPASRTKNPGVAYAAGKLGEIDPESVVFVDAAHSPSRKAGVFFSGAWSGTVSFWEFKCP